MEVCPQQKQNPMAPFTVRVIDLETPRRHTSRRVYRLFQRGLAEETQPECGHTSELRSQTDSKKKASWLPVLLSLCFLICRDVSSFSYTLPLPHKLGWTFSAMMGSSFSDCEPEQTCLGCLVTATEREAGFCGDRPGGHIRGPI